jgi:NADPH-dependent glutamate synthase beta subunit-like oxidoreductase
MPTLTIDNQAVTVPEGTTLLAAAAQVGIAIPALCWREGRRACTSCLVCVVRVDGAARLVPACATVAREGMVVESEVADIVAARRTALELLLSDHLGDCEGPCRLVCPAHMDIPAMCRHLAAGRMREAIAVIKAHIPLPATLGRICPELCEKGCRRAQHDGAVSICRLKRAAADADLASGTPYRPACRPDSGKRIAIAGAGPAGLSAAWFLRTMGHAVTLLDGRSQPGGILREAVDPAVLPPAVLDAEIRLILDLGITFVANSPVADPATLMKEYDAVLVAAGHLDEAAARILGLAWSGKGIAVGQGRMTAVPGLFACGGAVGPLRHAVRAVADGHAAARAIDAWLAGAPLPAEERPFSVHMGRVSPEEMALLLREASPAERTPPPDPLPMNERGEMLEDMTVAQATAEAARCLHCDCRKLAECRLRAAAMALDVPANPSYRERQPFTQDNTHPAVLYEAGKCIRCGLCVQIAEDAREHLGLAFVGRGFTVRVATPFNETLATGLCEVAAACVEACPTGALARREEHE